MGSLCCSNSEEDKERVDYFGLVKGGERKVHMVFEESNGQSDFFQICKDALQLSKRY